MSTLPGTPGLQAGEDVSDQTSNAHENTEPEIRGRPIPPGSIKTGPIPDFSEELRQMRETWQAVGNLDSQIRGQERNHSWLGRFKSFWKEISP